MIPYITNQNKLILPEYGRLVHDMVALCSQIEDRGQRTEFAALIVENMKAMTQQKGKYPDDRKFWDHLYIISGRNLDVDYPYGSPEDLDCNAVPSKIPFNDTDFKRRHYGSIIQKMVKQVALMPNSEEKDACVELIANHLKKILTVQNAENAVEERIYMDLEAMSEGNIALEQGIFDIPEFKEEKSSKNLNGQKRKKAR